MSDARIDARELDAIEKRNSPEHSWNAASEVSALIAEVRASWSECEKLKAALGRMLTARDEYAWKRTSVDRHEGDRLWNEVLESEKAARALVASAPQNEAVG